MNHDSFEDLASVAIYMTSHFVSDCFTDLSDGRADAMAERRVAERRMFASKQVMRRASQHYVRARPRV